LVNKTSVITDECIYEQLYIFKIRECSEQQSNPGPCGLSPRWTAHQMEEQLLFNNVKTDADARVGSSEASEIVPVRECRNLQINQRRAGVELPR
jgi:hypothetical protein